MNIQCSSWGWVGSTCWSRIRGRQQREEEEEEGWPILVDPSQGHSWKGVGPISVGAWDRQTGLGEGKRESVLCGECVVEVFLGWRKVGSIFRMGRSSHCPTPPVGKRREVGLDDLGGQLALCKEEVGSRHCLWTRALGM